jgi:hypothetical protein
VQGNVGDWLLMANAPPWRLSPSVIYAIGPAVSDQYRIHAEYEREEYQGAGIAGDAHIVRFCILPGGRLGGDVGQIDGREKPRAMASG